MKTSITGLLLFCIFNSNLLSQSMDTCFVFVATHKKNGKKYIYHKGVNSMLKLKNGKRFPTAEWLNFTDSTIHITKGFNSINRPYVGDTIIRINDVKWFFWDGIPRKKLRTNKFKFKIEKIYTNCEYRGWNNKYFQTETKMEDCNCK